MVLFLVLLCITQSGCAILQFPFDLLSTAVGSAVGIGAQVAQVGIAAAPYAGPFFF